MTMEDLEDRVADLEQIVSAILRPPSDDDIGAGEDAQGDEMQTAHRRFADRISRRRQGGGV